MAEWGKIGSRGDVEDRRGMGGMIGGGVGITGIALLFLFNLLSGGDLGSALDQVISTSLQNPPVQNSEEFEGNDQYEIFASTVLGSANDMWEEKFREEGRDYEPPKLVLFRSATQSGCGTATSAVGPHYCPADQTIYLDETFFEELQRRFGAQGGDVAEAYVIAHEVGHHAQNELGVLQRAGGSNEDSIRVELQADCFAGLWANYVEEEFDVFSQGEIQEAMDAAAAVGDDRIQESTQGRVNPENWTHGSSEQRVEWFDKGFETGNLDSCNTF